MMSPFKGFILLLAVILMQGCGGAPQDNPNYLERIGAAPTSRTITVTVAGANGAVVIELGGRTVTFDDNGTREVSGFSLTETITASFTTTPDGQQCYFSPSNQQQITAGAAVVVECGDPRVSGTVKNFFTDDALDGVTVRVTSDMGGGSYGEFTSVTTDAGGAYEVTGITAGERYVLTISAAGFAPQTTVALPTAARPVVTENIFLVPENASVALDPAADMVFSVDGITVLEVPANGLVDADNNAPVGQVTGRITLRDPSSAPRALTGWYEASTGGNIDNLESFGGLSVLLTDQNGAALELAAGVTAQVSVPVATSAIGGSPNNASIYSFDEDSGYWQSPANATLALQGTVSVYEATLSSLGETLMAGQTYTPVNIQGCLEDSRGNRIAGATVVSQGLSYIGLAFGATDAQGDFTVPARPSSSVLVYGLVGSQSRTVETTTTTGDTTLTSCILLDETSTTITLTWGENPSDLDSQLFGPLPDSSGRFRVYFGNRSQEVNGVTIFLDVDDVTGFGPEVTTIPSFPLAETYEFFVDLFSGSSTIQASPARVEVNAQGENFAFSPAEGSPTECWHVFNITVDSSLTGTVVPVNSWVSDNACSAGLFNGESSAPPTSVRKVSPAQQAIERKYYAR